MRSLVTLVVAALLFLAAPAAIAGRVSGPQAKAHIGQRLQYSSKVADKQRPFKTKLGGKKGDRLRPFTADNIRTETIPYAGPTGGITGGMRITVGNQVTGTLDMTTGAVRVKAVSQPRGMPLPRVTPEP